ncbi:hypothetical protein [Plantactinospora sp. WMMB782]|uniref:hypothetical protein n=1 Tax=Plantactinospora sp. WMMB782 TaxID=3404121 RepID=UPI003B932E95
MRKLIGLLLVLALAGGLGYALARPEPSEPEAPPAPRLTLCATEDQETDCRWDAASQGNGRGRSFVRLAGETHYEED